MLAIVLSLLYGVAGFLELWFLLTLWGFTNGPINVTPYIALVGCLLLFLLAAPMAVLVDRVGAAVAVLGAVLACAWALAPVSEGAVWDAVAIAGLPILAGAFASAHLWLSRKRRWLSAPSTPPLPVRIGFAVVPLVVFGTLFNAKLVLGLLFVGPPR
jgi:hypothetical protein